MVVVVVVVAVVGRGGGGGPGRFSLIWPIRGCATGQGLVLFPKQPRVYNLARVYPKQGI